MGARDLRDLERIVGAHGRFGHRDLIASHGARAEWTEPDLRPLPGVR